MTHSVTPAAAHRWIHGGLRADRERVAALGVSEASAIDMHRRLRGPYTAAGALLRQVVPAALATGKPDVAELLGRHDVEILSMAPELHGTIPSVRDTLTSLAVPRERTRFYSRMRTLRMAHGIAELLRDLPDEVLPSTVVLENAEHADHTDAELFSVLLRRIPAARMALVVCSGAPEVPSEVLAAALSKHAVTHPIPAATFESRAAAGDSRALAAAYIEADCVLDDPVLRAAYELADPAERARLHDERADALEALGEPSLLMGAVPFHREHGADPAGRGADALRHALDRSIDMGFYDHTVELGIRGRAVIDWEAQGEHWWAFTTKMTTSLAALSRADEAELLYNEARAFTADPSIHMQAAYATSMLFTRHFSDDRKDDTVAKGWANQAIAFATMIPDPKERAFQSAFMRNGLALIEVHLKNYEKALKLVNDGLDRLDRELEPDEHRLHRSVLRYNRGQVYAALGQIENALADYDAVIEDDPNYSEYWFDRGNLLRRIGRDEEALANYERAMQLSPPFAEVYYNRADVLLALGDVDSALADLDYVLEIDPEYVDALVNRAGLRVDLGDLAGARADVDTGLGVAPGNPHLLSVLGQLEARAGRLADAVAAYDRALAADARLVPAWAGRAAVLFDAGDLEGALADLNHALDLGEDAALLFNRATALQAAGRWTDALADLDKALDLEPGDEDIVAERARVLAQLPAPSQSSEA